MALHTIVEHDTTHIKPYIDKVKQALMDLTDLVEGATEITTKSFAPVIAVNDALPVNAVDVSAKIEPIQAGSGTPSPSNVRAISGRDSVKVTRAGKNLFNKADVTQYYYIDKDGELHENSSFCLSNYIGVKGGTSITISGHGDNITPAICWYTKDKTYINGVNYNGSSTKTISLPSNASYVRMSVGSIVLPTAQLEVGETATSYEPYQGEAYTIQLGDTYYGGTLDVTTGVLTVDKSISTIPTITEFQTLGTIENKYMHYSINDMYLKDGSTPINDCICEKLSYIPGINGQLGYYHLSRRIYVGVTNDYTVEGFNSEIAGSKVVYPLDNPFTVQLTPQEIQMLQGNNTIFTDSGDTSIQYYANGVKNLETVVAKMQTEADGAMNNQFKNGAVNLLPNTKTSGVESGITYIVNDDGSVLANAGGTAGSGGSTFPIKASADNWKLPAGRYKLTGAPSNIDTSIIRLNATIILTSGHTSISENGDAGSGIEFTITDAMVADSNYKVAVFINVIGSKTLSSNMLFKPMITVADMPNSDYAHYVPYAKSNRQLMNEQYISGYEVTAQQNFTDYYDVTIPKDGMYLVGIQNNSVDSGSAILVRLGTYSYSLAIVNHRTTGQQYEYVSSCVPLKKGVVLRYSCNNSTLECQAQLYKLTY